MINKNNRIFIYISYISNYFNDHILQYIYSLFNKDKNQYQNHINDSEPDPEPDPEPININININTQKHVDDYLKTKVITPLKIDLAVIESMNQVYTSPTTTNKKEKTKNKKQKYIKLKLEM